MVRRWQGELSVWSNSRQKYKSQGTFEAHLPPGVTLPSILEFDQPVSKEEVEMRAGTPVDITLSAESERYAKSLMAMETTFDNRKVLPARRTDDAPPSMLIIGMEIGPPLKLTLHVGGAEVELREAGEAKARHASNGASNGAGNGAASSNGAGNGANANVAPSVGVKRPRDDEHNKNNEGEREPRIDSEWLKGMDVEVKTNFFRLNVGDGLVVTQYHVALTNPSVPPDEKGEPAPAAATKASTVAIFKRHKDKFELLVPKGAAAYSYDGDKIANSTAPLRIDELARSRGWEMAEDGSFVCEYDARLA